MNKKSMHVFLNNISTSDNASLVEAIRNGYNAIFEGYADVVEDRTDALSRYNDETAYNSMLSGNPVLSFLQKSSNRLNSDYYLKYPDEEPELDIYTTTIYYEDLVNTESDENVYLNRSITTNDADVDDISDFSFDNSELDKLV